MKKEQTKTAPGMPFPAPMLPVSWYKFKKLDVAYDDQSIRQKFDIFYPDETSRDLPVVFYIHGGGFEMGDKRSGYIFSVIRGLKQGYAVGSINYRLSYEKPFPACVDDVRNAIRYIRLHARELRIDPDRIGVIGESAGGNLAAMLAVNPTSDIFDAEVPEALRGVDCSVCCAADLFGPLDFGVMYDQLKASGFKAPPFPPDESPEVRYLGTKTLRENEHLLAQANPVTHVSDKTAPMYLMHGTKDHNVPIQQTQKLYEVLQQNHVPAELVIVENAAHMSFKFMKKEYMGKVWRFFDRYLRG